MKRRTRRAHASWVSVVCAAVLAAATPAGAIVVCDDPALHEVTPPSDYDMVGYVNATGGATAVLVDPWWVLTAGHVTDFGTENKTFTLHLEDGSVVCAWADVRRHSSIDLALIRLDRDTELAGYTMYTGTGEEGEEGILVGYGMSGTGTNPGEGGNPDYPRGTKRYGYNRIDSAYYSSLDQTHYLRMDFDDPDSSGPFGTLGVDKEVMIALGDSGGATFLDVGGTLKLAGIHVGYKDMDGDGIWPEYGDRGYDVRVRSYTGWVNGLIPDQPATVTGDFNIDGVTDDADIDQLHEQIRTGGTDLWHDVTGDDTVTGADATQLITGIMGTYFGDANLDYVVDVLDLAVVANNFGLSEQGWSDGDFNGDAVVDVLDLARLANNFGSGDGGGEALVVDDGPGGTIPEPASAAILLIGLPLLRRRR